MPRTQLACDGKPLPFAYRWLVEQGLIQFGRWHFVDTQDASDAFRAEFRREVAAPNPSSIRDMQSFAQHGACDDFAGFVVGEGEPGQEVLCVHLTFSGKIEPAGYPSMTLYANVWEWLSDCVIEEMRLVAERMEEYHSR